MIRVNCDMCGHPIDYEENGVNLTFNSYGVVNFMKPKHKEYQLCDECAGKIAEMLDAAYDKLDINKEGVERR